MNIRTVLWMLIAWVVFITGLTSMFWVVQNFKPTTLPFLAVLHILGLTIAGCVAALFKAADQ